ncbi:MAG: hypothetical protein C3F12_09570 [Candidatus Methylomirabilota bacterium]|nr:hypothetical protein [Candidatus Methylomirabilis sp.]NJD69471.1 hypothetical protein [candidate division NC10 bacterium]PWB46280.1 MAG: hypothetical protein C3F12_09570 [candidate division NC10 bacterium]
MVILIIILLFLLALLPVLIPFFKSRAVAVEVESADLQELLDEKQMIYAAIKELDFDRQAGKLSLEDYEQARHSYELRAIAILQAIDRVGGRQDDQKTQSPRKRRR